MHFSGLVLSAAMALSAVAVPLEARHEHRHHHEERRRLRHIERQANTNTFPIQVTNKCSAARDFGLFQLDGYYQPSQVGSTQNLAPGDSAVFDAPFHGSTMRISGNADWPIGDQIANVQPLFEFGYAPGWAGVMSGTAYDLSLMPGSSGDVGISVEVLDNGNGSLSCESKLCLNPFDCAADQGWTNQDQSNIGSPADTVCYHGPAAMHVTWCPS